MKKIILMLLVASILICSTCVAEVDIDVSQYSIEELIELRALIDAEINARSTDLSVLYPGRYVIGSDIAVGTYYLVGVIEDSDGIPPFVLYSESSDKLNDGQYIDYRYVDIGTKWRISLEDGMILEIQTGGCIIEKADVLSVAQ